MGSLRRSRLERPFGRALCAALCLALPFSLGACRSADPFSALAERVRPHAGAVVCEHPLAAAVGVEILRRGGNAADAAVATALALAVVYPQAGNLGGGGFALSTLQGGTQAEDEALAFDFREVTPGAYEARLYLDRDGQVVSKRSLDTPLAVGVPGSPAGLHALYQRHGSGRLSFGDLCQPAIRLAEEGFFVDPWLAQGLRSHFTRGSRMTVDPAARERFFPGGEPLGAGELLVQRELAGTLRRLARDGPAGFYAGETAQALLACLDEANERCGDVTHGNDMTLEDLGSYEVRIQEPLVGWFRGHQVLGMNPPSSGGVVLLQVLAILEGMPLGADRARSLLAEAEPDIAADGSGISAQALHWWIEAMRCAFADRAQHLGDPSFYPVPVDELLSAERIAERRVAIGDQARVDVGPLDIALARESLETTHLSVIDREGNAVSLTTTLNASFGSGIMVPGAGFLLNNELDDFSIRAGTPNMYGLVGGAANQLQPGKRPLSSMTPTIVRDASGRVVLVIGAPGGPRIITAVIQVMLRVFVYGQSLSDAVAAPRLHQQWAPAETLIEKLGSGRVEAWAPGLIEALAERHGQPLGRRSGGFASVQAIGLHEDGEVEVASDPRRGGVGVREDRPMPPQPSPPGG